MLDTLAVARRLTATGIESTHAEAIADVVREAAEHGDHVTPEQLDLGLAGVRTEIAELRTEMRTEIASVRNEVAGVRGAVSDVETRLSWRMLAIAGLIVAALRLLD